MSYARALSILAIVFLAVLPFQVNAEACPRLPALPPFSNKEPPQGCVCGSPIRNLTISLSKDFSARAACALRWVYPNNSAIDLSKDTVTLDQYTNDRYPWGEVLLVGSVTIIGALAYEPGNSGDLFFSPTGNPIAPKETVLGRKVLTLKLSEYSPDEFRVPNPLRQLECWTAQVTLKVEDVWVLLGEGDSSGAYPAKYTVVSATNHSACK